MWHRHGIAVLLAAVAALGFVACSSNTKSIDSAANEGGGTGIGDATGTGGSTTVGDTWDTGAESEVDGATGSGGTTGSGGMTGSGGATSTVPTGTCSPSSPFGYLQCSNDQLHCGVGTAGCNCLRNFPYSCPQTGRCYATASEAAAACGSSTCYTCIGATCAIKSCPAGSMIAFYTNPCQCVPCPNCSVGHIHQQGTCICL